MGIMKRGRSSSWGVPSSQPSPWGSSSQAGKVAGPGRAVGSGVWHRAWRRGSHRPGTQREVCSCPLGGRQAGGWQPRDTPPHPNTYCMIPERLLGSPDENIDCPHVSPIWHLLSPCVPPGKDQDGLDFR